MSARRAGRVKDWLYADTPEPDVRFTLANERTFLAWIRTALAFLAVGVAVDALGVGGDTIWGTVAPSGMALLSVWCAGWSWWSWARSERAIRRDEPLPAHRASPVLSLGVVAAVLLVAGALVA